MENISLFIFIILLPSSYHVISIGYRMRGEVHDIIFNVRGTILYLVVSERSGQRTKYDIVTRAIKLMILLNLECDIQFIHTYFQP